MSEMHPCSAVDHQIKVGNEANHWNILKKKKYFFPKRADVKTYGRWARYTANNDITATDVYA